MNKKFETILYIGKDIYGGLENNNNSDRKNYSSIDIRFFGIVLLKCKKFYFLSKLTIFFSKILSSPSFWKKSKNMWRRNENY